MNYKFETIMTWVTYLRNGIWEINEDNDYVDDPEVVKSKYEDLFFVELLKEFNDARHLIQGLYTQVSTFTVFINPNKHEFKVNDNYNLLRNIYNGIFKEYDGKRLCLKVNKHGFNKTFKTDNGYFEFRDREDDEHVFIKSIVEGTCNVSTPNVRRMISLLYARQFQYLESTNPNDFMFMDYFGEEREEMIKDCEQYDKWINKKKQTKKVMVDNE